jgi:hypothetical protein
MLLARLEVEYGASFEERTPTMLELESVLKDTFNDVAYVILDWILDELENSKDIG